MQQSAEDEAADTPAVFCWCGVLRPGKQQGQQNAGQDLGSPQRDEPRLLCLSEWPDQYVKEKEGRERVIRKNKALLSSVSLQLPLPIMAQMLTELIFRTFVQEIACPNSFCLQCVYCMKIQPLT